MTPAELITLARKAPLTRNAVADLARKAGPEKARDAAAAALDSAGVIPAMVLAFAAASAGDKLPASLTRALLPEVVTLDHVGPLVHATEGDPLDVLVAFLDDKRGDLELECLVMLLAAEACADQPPPRAMLSRGRWLARHQLRPEASVFLGAAAQRLRDPDLSSLCTPHVSRARRAKKTIDDTLAAARLPPLEALSDADGTRLSSGFTVKNDGPSVGRNDPCPCGSGKKYKKCHALSESSAEPAEPPKLDPKLLGPDQTALLRPSEIAALETSLLSPKAFVEAFRRVVDLRQWTLALRMIGEAKARKDLGDHVRRGNDPVTSFVLDAFHGAQDAGAREAAEELHALLPAETAASEQLSLDCLRAPPDLLSRIEDEAEAALRNDSDGARGVLLADTLLRAFPALGIYVARGALHEGRTGDSQALLEQIEDARDRLLLSPSEPWWDVYESFFDNRDERQAQAKDDSKREKMKEDLRRARAASRKTAAELEKLQQRVVELDRSIAAPAPAAPKPEAPSADLVEERRRLKTKIDELQRIIGEGQDERRDLRRQLADREEREEDDAPVKSSREDDDAEPDDLLDRSTPDLPRAILVPRYTDRAAKAVQELAADAADGVLTVVASLAAGKPNAWGGVKQLAKVRGVLSARAGIHHRVLFTIADRSLEVLEVLHRRDLEQIVARLARTA